MDLIERLRGSLYACHAIRGYLDDAGFPDDGDAHGQLAEIEATLTEAAAALEAAREDACVALVADIRFACGDNGKRMQPELVEYIRELAEDAERYRLMRKGGIDDLAVVRGLGAMDYGMSAVISTYSEEIDGDDLDAAIDAALAKEDE